MEVRVAKFQSLSEEPSRNSWMNIFKNLRWNFSKTWLRGGIDVYIPAFEYVINNEVKNTEIYFPFVVRTTSKIEKVFIDNVEKPVRSVNYGNRFVIGSGRKIFYYADEKKISDKKVLVKYELSSKKTLFTNYFSFHTNFGRELLRSFFGGVGFSLSVNKTTQLKRQGFYDLRFETQTTRECDCNRQVFYTTFFSQFTTTYLKANCLPTNWQKFNVYGWLSCETWVV